MLLVEDTEPLAIAKTHLQDDNGAAAAANKEPS
jgi:hypothetical protein